MRYKIGDKLRIVKDDDGVHAFKVDDTVTVVYIGKKSLPGGLLCVRERDDVANYLIPDYHAEPVETLGKKIKKFFKTRKEPKQ